MTTNNTNTTDESTEIIDADEDRAHAVRDELLDSVSEHVEDTVSASVYTAEEFDYDETHDVPSVAPVLMLNVPYDDCDFEFLCELEDIAHDHDLVEIDVDSGMPEGSLWGHHPTTFVYEVM